MQQEVNVLSLFYELWTWLDLIVHMKYLMILGTNLKQIKRDSIALRIHTLLVYIVGREKSNTNHVQ